MHIFSKKLVVGHKNGSEKSTYPLTKVLFGIVIISFILSMSNFLSTYYIAQALFEVCKLYQ